ncbi:MAG: PaaI family thioesterase [Pseudomonadota bacterium]
MSGATLPHFDLNRFVSGGFHGHGGRLGIQYVAHGVDWAEIALPYDRQLIGDPDSGVIASGPILALMDMATSIGVWLKLGAFHPHATLDLRVDYLRPATPGKTVIGRGECYRITRSIAFVRGQAHDGDPGDPLAHVAGTFMSIGGYK